jgi:hypothetical protein
MTPVTEISETKSQHMSAWPRHGPVIKSSNMSMTSPVTPVELKVMAQFPWRLTEWKRERANRKAKARTKASLVVSGQAVGFMDVVEAVDAQTKERAKESQKENPKERKVVPRKVAPKERRLAEEKLHTVNVQIVWNLAIGPRIARTWSIKLQANKNRLLQVHLPLLLSRQPKLQAIQL